MDFRSLQRKKKLHTQKVSSEWQEYYEASKALSAKLSEKLILCPEVVKIYREVRKIAHHPKNRVPIPKLTKILITTKDVLQGPTPDDRNNEVYREDIRTLHDQSNAMKAFPITRCLVGALACLIGLVILVASGILGAVSFGLALPVTVFGMVFGASMVFGGVAIASGLIGSSFLMFGAPMVVSAMTANPLRNGMNKLEASAKRVYGVSTHFLSG
jgi:hypothetical protein